MIERQHQPPDANTFYMNATEQARTRREADLSEHEKFIADIAMLTPNVRYTALRQRYPNGLPTDGFREVPQSEHNLE